MNEREFILVHAGLDHFDRQCSLDDYRLNEVLFHAPDYNTVYFEDKYLVTGHIPTRIISEKMDLSHNPGYRDEIFMANHHIAIDCGSGAMGGRLGCIRLDDFREFYIDC